MTRTVHINRDWTSLTELKQIGAHDDDATGLRGVRRLEVTDAGAEARRRCVRATVGNLDIDGGQTSVIPRQAAQTIDVLANAVLRLAGQP